MKSHSASRDKGTQQRHLSMLEVQACTHTYVHTDPRRMRAGRLPFLGQTCFIKILLCARHQAYGDPVPALMKLIVWLFWAQIHARPGWPARHSPSPVARAGLPWASGASAFMSLPPSKNILKYSCLGITMTIIQAECTVKHYYSPAHGSALPTR